MQTLEVKITIPDDHVLITKVEYEELQSNKRLLWWSMKDLERQTQRSRPWLMKNIIDHPQFGRKIDSFIMRPNGENGQYRFQASKMAQFLEENFERIKEEIKCY